jgi:hypothetical protein
MFQLLLESINQDLVYILTSVKVIIFLWKIKDHLSRYQFLQIMEN